MIGVGIEENSVKNYGKLEKNSENFENLWTVLKNSEGNTEKYWKNLKNGEKLIKS